MTLPVTFEGPATAPRSWRAPSQPLLTRIDLQGLVERGALSGLHMQSDGSLILDCPGGLPAELEGLVEAAEEDRVARLERELGTLTAELEEREKLSDRLEAVEFGLAERLQGVIAEEVLNLFAEQEEGPNVVERIESLLTSVREAPDVIEQITARLPDPALLESRLEEIANRPLPQIDLTPMRQMNERFLQAMQQVMSRLDQAVGEMAPATPDTEVLDRLTALEALIAAQQPAAPDLEPFFARLDAALGPLQTRMEDLALRMSALETRPDPVLDLTEQRKSFAGYATALSTALRRIEALDEKFADLPALQAGIDRISAELGAQNAPGPDLIEPVLAALAARKDPDLSTIEQALAELAQRPAIPDMSPALLALQDNLDKLGERIAALETPPDPVLDLTEQRKSFASFATALGATLRRIEGVAEKWEASPSPLPDLGAKLDAIAAAQAHASHASLTDAILTLAERASSRELPPLPGFDAFKAAQQDFFQDLRFLLAEIIATQMRQQALAS